MGSYESSVILTDSDGNFNSFPLYIQVISNNKPPYFDEKEWEDSQPVQLYFDQGEVDYEFPAPRDDDFDDMEILVDMVDFDQFAIWDEAK